MYSPKRLPESLCQVIPAWLHAMESLTMFMKMTAAWRTDSCRSTDLEDEESHHDWRGWQPWWQGTWGRTAAKPTIMQTNYSFFQAPFLTVLLANCSSSLQKMHFWNYEGTSETYWATSSSSSKLSSLVTSLYGQESPGWISLFKVGTFYFFENIQRLQFFL